MKQKASIILSALIKLGVWAAKFSISSIVTANLARPFVAEFINSRMRQDALEATGLIERCHSDFLNFSKNTSPSFDTEAIAKNVYRLCTQKALNTIYWPAVGEALNKHSETIYCPEDYQKWTATNFPKPGVIFQNLIFEWDSERQRYPVNIRHDKFKDQAQSVFNSIVGLRH